MKYCVISLTFVHSLVAGPFAPPAGMTGSDAIAAESQTFIQWASTGDLLRGKTDITSVSSFDVSFGSIEDALGPADSELNDFFSVVSLGDGGQATLSFPRPIYDIPGFDFAVFENSFQDDFLELAHVEVSSNGIDFFRFPSISLTQTTTQVGTFGYIDTTNIHQLAGKYRGGYGTPFDLKVMKRLFPSLDTQRITHVRIIDVVGSIDPAFGSRDSLGNLINDPFKTNFFTGGFDLDAIGALSALPAHFETWITSQNLSGNVLPPLIEYFTGGTQIDIVQAGSFAFDWLSYRSDRAFWVEGSADLQTWQTLARSDQGGEMLKIHPDISLVVVGQYKKRVSIQTLPSNPLRYFRLAAE